MGKRNRRNRAKKNKTAAGATTTAEDSWSAVLDGIFSESEAVVPSAAAVGNSGDGTRSCYHGSSKEAFRNDEYRKAGREWVESSKAQQSEGECHEAFRIKHARLMIDEKFGKYLSAVCARDYLLHGFGDGDEVRSVAIVYLLRLAISIRYLYVPWGEGKDVSGDIECNEKRYKYMRDILTARGVVNVLARETRCGCFNGAKKAAKTMEKVGRCFGCNEECLKERLLKCPCGISQYCTKECQREHWHTHKDVCIAKRKSRSKTNTANGDDSDGDGGAGTAAKEEGMN